MELYETDGTVWSGGGSDGFLGWALEVIRDLEPPLLRFHLLRLSTLPFEDSFGPGHHARPNSVDVENLPDSPRLQRRPGDGAPPRRRPLAGDRRQLRRRRVRRPPRVPRRARLDFLGGRREADGFGDGWGDDLGRLYLEYWSESWWWPVWGFEDGLGFEANGRNYAGWADACFEAIRSSPWHRPGLRLVAHGFAATAGEPDDWNDAVDETGRHHDLLDVVGYIPGELSDASTAEAIFGTAFAQVEAHRRRIESLQQTLADNGRGTELVAYEIGSAVNTGDVALDLAPIPSGTARPGPSS